MAGDLTISTINGGPISGMRNTIINGNFGINQRGYVSGAATTAGQYTLDRWKVTGTGGITFSTVNSKTTVTIPSGQVLQQVIEGLNLQDGTYTLSWEGTAQGKIGAGSFSGSGVTATVTGGTNLTIEFGPGTVSRVQFEPGSVATAFEHRPYGAELALCQRYYEAGSVASSGFKTAISSGAAYNAKDVSFAVPKRAAPTVALDSVSYVQASAATVGLVLTGGFSVYITAGSANSNFQISSGNWTASAEL